MKALVIAAIVGTGLVGASGPVQAQYYGGPERGYDRGYGEREYRGRDRDDGERRYRSRDDDRGRGGYRERRVEFDEREYLRCHPDVRRAVQRGEARSGLQHYQLFGRREGRRLSC